MWKADHPNQHTQESKGKAQRLMFELLSRSGLATTSHTTQLKLLSVVTNLCLQMPGNSIEF